VRDHRPLWPMLPIGLRRRVLEGRPATPLAYARAPKKSAVLARPATHSAYLRSPTSDSPRSALDESDKSTGRRGDQSMRESVDRSAQFVGCFFEDDAGRTEDKELA